MNTLDEMRIIDDNCMFVYFCPTITDYETICKEKNLDFDDFIGIIDALQPGVKTLTINLPLYPFRTYPIIEPIETIYHGEISIRRHSRNVMVVDVTHPDSNDSFPAFALNCKNAKLLGEALIAKSEEAWD